MLEVLPFHSVGFHQAVSGGKCRCWNVSCPSQEHILWLGPRTKVYCKAVCDEKQESPGFETQHVAPLTPRLIATESHKESCTGKLPWKKQCWGDKSIFYLGHCQAQSIHYDNFRLFNNLRPGLASSNWLAALPPYAFFSQYAKNERNVKVMRIK